MVINGDQARDMLLLYDENGCFGMDVADKHEFIRWMHQMLLQVCSVAGNSRSDRINEEPSAEDCGRQIPIF